MEGKMANSIAVTDDTFEGEVLKSELPVLVDFWAEWCGPCKAIAPVVEEIAEEYSGRLKVMKLDVDSDQSRAVEFGIRGIPALLIFNEGQVARTIVGAVPKSTIVKNVEEVLSGSSE